MNKSSCIKEKGFYINTITFILFIILYGCNHSDIVHPIRKDIYETVYASGKIFAANEHTIFSTGNGILIKKLVYDGDTTKENLPLFQIKNITATSALKVSHGKINLLQQFSSPQNLQKNNYIFSDCDGII